MTKGSWVITLASFAFCFVVIAYNGFKLPWNEDAALYAIYGCAVGFYLATALAMFMVWIFSRKKI
ncbi:hypothetical protein AGMMS50276_03740 [Synergistales bacterium]|nr:hypothetical protein AGMMS50276_03740 [Synergistales bacterium]